MPNPECPFGHGEMDDYEVPEDLQIVFPTTHNHYICNTCNKKVSIPKEV